MDEVGLRARQMAGKGFGAGWGVVGPKIGGPLRWKQRHFNERLLGLFIERLALKPSWVKNHPCDHELRTYGAIAA